MTGTGDLSKATKFLTSTSITDGMRAVAGVGVGCGGLREGGGRGVGGRPIRPLAPMPWGGGGEEGGCLDEAKPRRAIRDTVEVGCRCLALTALLHALTANKREFMNLCERVRDTRREAE